MNIYRNIPMVKSKYPYLMMDIGESFVCDYNAARSANQWMKRLKENRKFAGRIEGDKFKIWRIE